MTLSSTLLYYLLGQCLLPPPLRCFRSQHNKNASPRNHHTLHEDDDDDVDASLRDLGIHSVASPHGEHHRMPYDTGDAVSAELHDSFTQDDAYKYNAHEKNSSATELDSSPASILQLQEAKELSKDEYQKHWTQLQHESTTTFSLRHSGRPDSVEQLEQLFSKWKIFTLASGTIESLLKLYVYAQDTSSHWYLCEVVFDTKERQMNIKVKTRTLEETDKWCKYFQAVLEKF